MGKMIYSCLFVILMLTVAHGDHHKDHHHKDHHHKDHHHDHHDNTDHKIHINKELIYHKIAPGNFEFAFKFFRHIASKPAYTSKNIFFSPFSISAAFAMLSLGAKSDTLTQILGGLGFNLTTLSEADIHEGFEHLLHLLNNDTSELQLNTGNGLFLREGVKFLPKFLEDIQHYYQASAFNTDFKKSAEATKEINDIVEKKTHGKIVKFLQEVDPDTVALLVNYIVFRGKWEKPFDPAATKQTDFFVNENTTVTVPMMSRSGRFNIFHDQKLACDVIDLRYKGNAAMLLILPEAGKLHQVEEALSLDRVKGWLESSTDGYAMIKLPKFSITGSYQLKELLHEMGIINVFSDSADLSGIVEEPRLKVSKAIHKAVLDVDEKGTDAAATTIIEMMPLSVLRQYIFNRPFLLLICKHDTQTVLFLGRVVNPVQSSVPK